MNDDTQDNQAAQPQGGQPAIPQENSEELVTVLRDIAQTIERLDGKLEALERRMEIDSQQASLLRASIDRLIDTAQELGDAMQERATSGGER